MTDLLSMGRQVLASQPFSRLIGAELESFREGAAELDPDQEVQGAIRTIFTQFERLGTATAVLHFFNAHGLRIPRRCWHAQAGAEIVWTELTLQELEARLAGYGFVRVHRRALLNLAHVDRLRRLATGGYLAITRQGDEVPVSRQEARRLRQRLGL